MKDPWNIHEIPRGSHPSARQQHLLRRRRHGPRLGLSQPPLRARRQRLHRDAGEWAAHGAAKHGRIGGRLGKIWGWKTWKNPEILGEKLLVGLEKQRILMDLFGAEKMMRLLAGLIHWYWKGGEWNPGDWRDLTEFTVFGLLEWRFILQRWLMEVDMFEDDWSDLLEGWKKTDFGFNW